MNKGLKLIIIVLVAILLGLWSPWLNWKINIGELFGVRAPEKIAGLQLTSLSGELEIFIDNESKGKVTTENSPLIVDKVTPGERLVRIVRVTDSKTAYWEYNSLITFEENKNVVMAYSIGPEKEFSEGHVIYATNKNPNDDNNLQINVNTPDAKVELDGSVLQINKNTAVGKIDFSKQYEITISKNGFDTAKFKILPEEQSERDKLKEVTIHVDVQLIYQPVTVE